MIVWAKPPLNQPATSKVGNCTVNFHHNTNVTTDAWIGLRSAWYVCGSGKSPERDTIHDLNGTCIEWRNHIVRYHQRQLVDDSLRCKNNCISAQHADHRINAEVIGMRTRQDNNVRTAEAPVLRLTAHRIDQNRRLGQLYHDTDAVDRNGVGEHCWQQMRGRRLPYSVNIAADQPSGMSRCAVRPNLRWRRRKTHHGSKGE